jgi:hypothetical protein
MNNRALQERVLEDVVFTLVKNSEEVNFEKVVFLGDPTLVKSPMVFP